MLAPASPLHACCCGTGRELVATSGNRSGDRSAPIPNRVERAGDDRRGFFGPQPPDPPTPRRTAWVQLRRAGRCGCPPPPAAQPHHAPISPPCCPTRTALAGVVAWALSSRAAWRSASPAVAPGSAPSWATSTASRLKLRLREVLSSALALVGLHAPPLCGSNGHPAYVSRRNGEELAAQQACILPCSMTRPHFAGSGGRARLRPTAVGVALWMAPG